MAKMKNLALIQPQTGGTFYDLAKAHVATHGGRWFIADRRTTPQQWRAWMAYFAWLDDQPVPRGRKVTSFRGLDADHCPRRMAARLRCERAARATA